MRDKSYTQKCPKLPPSEENGFKCIGDIYLPITWLNLPAPKAVMELTMCKFKKGYINRCSCFSNFCHAHLCVNVFYHLCDNSHTERTDDEYLAE